MDYTNIENKLLDSIEDNDSHKSLKQLQIKRWLIAYWPLVQSFGERKALFLKKVFDDKDYWGDDLDKPKLNRYTVGRKLLALKDEDGKKSFLSSFDKYKIACWCCFEKEIKTIFDEFKLEQDTELSENLVGNLNKGALMIFWSHYINRDNLSEEDKNKYSYKYGFECAIVEKFVEALEFFFKELTNIPLEEREDLLMQAAIYKRIHVSANAEMVDFCIRNIRADKYPELLKRDLERNGYYSTVCKLQNEYFFDSAKKLLESLTEFTSYDEYSSLIYSVLGNIKSAADKNLITAAESFLDFIWTHSIFSMHQQSFLSKISNLVSASRDLMTDLIIESKATKILSKIINSLNPEQMEYINKDSPLSYEKFNLLKQNITAMEIQGNAVTPILGNNPVNFFNPSLYKDGAGDMA
ncbi:hypothetical protein [unidentified bacterial endosymbiont]|uniref:hypothetical protein n=1 Tax=unidentified bacterial endosymbiont TaxID=2355 RepID=UPI00209D6064|nr:hypothetical protein [unidentified bacterial endosymbiont]